MKRSTGLRFHLHSHTFPVNRQVIWLDFPDVITDADMEQLLLVVDSLLTE